MSYITTAEISPTVPFLMTADGTCEITEKERILLVDDSPTTRKMFSNCLSGEVECAEAGSFEEAIFQLKTSEFAVVITDIIMPGLSGIELLRKIIADYPNTVVIIVSGINRPQRALDAMRLGAFDYIIKPCDPEVLKVTVDRAIRHRTLLVEAYEAKLDLETKNEELSRRTAQLECLQAQIIQSEKMASLGQLAAGVAHELNNPVGFVHANLEVLDKYVGDLVRLIRFYDEAAISPTAEEEVFLIKQQIGYPAVLDDINSMISDCREGSDRIRDIVQNLRTFSRLDEADYKETVLHEGLDATIRLLSRYFSSGNITLIRDYGDLPLIGAFSGQLNQVWMNLLVNAAQAIGNRKGVVKIVTTADVENVYVEITDTGSGIAVQYLKHIFEPFYTTKPVGEGTGLGLSISFGIVERHGGSISVNTKLNEGTSFQVRIPRNFQPSMLPAEKSIARYKENI